MTVTKPLSVLVIVAGYFGLQSCVTDNPAAYEGILGPERKPPEETPNSGGSGGSAGSSTTGGSAPTGGSTPTGGTLGEGGMGDGGATQGGTSGSAGSGGTTVNPPPHPDFMPPCYLGPTSAGEEILKGVACAPEDPPRCYRPCGPAQVGWKLEECRAGVYAEEDCRFPLDGDYSCYRLPDDPTTIDCGLTAAPAARDECDVAPCTSCNFEGFYEDTGGDAKEGYCTCRDADETGVRRWTCASATAWPCPTSQGCF